MFMDISSEMIHGVLPLFLILGLNSSVTTIGLIEGVSEAVALITKTFSGALSDWIGKRKTLVLAGYALGTATKPLFAVAQGVGLVFAARALDRVGKGIRGAPRDALVADVTDIGSRGAAYGLRQSLDTVGAFLGPLLATGLMIATADNFRFVFWIAVVPGLLAVGTIILAVKEPKSSMSKATRPQIHVSDIRLLGHDYRLVIVVGSLFAMARFSEAFLLLRAHTVGMASSMIPLMLVLMNVVYSATAFPAGHLSDRVGRKGVLIAGFAALIGADLVLFSAETASHVAAGIALWGLHMGLTQGLLAALVADTSPQSLRGTAFGVFGMVTGLATLLSSLTAGWLWDSFGPHVTFLVGCIFAAMSLAGYLVLPKRWSPLANF